MSTNRFLRKILAPTLPPVILHRVHLLRVLEEALIADGSGGPTAYRLLLLCAPAGYGKTTLLADTVKSLSIACCWYFLDRSDGDQGTFLRVLLASIRQRFPDFGSQLDALQATVEQDQPANYQHLLDAVIDALETDISERCLLALCNYHEVSNNQAINEIVNQLLKRLPPQYTLVLESRATLDLDLTSLIASRQVFSIGSNGLRFS